ncbi:MAG TPA: sulfotransferase [Pirellulaceae bacterium]|nr:sulfotransferase [Pirellulaceae bacterium]
MPPTPADRSSHPGWTEAAPWMGCSLPALVRILAGGRFRVDLASWPECLVDLVFASGNSAAGLVQKVIFGGRAARTELTADPVFVIGHWRTGTTLLHELLALDPRLRAPTTYECLAPHHFLLTGSWLPRLTTFALPKTRPPDKMRVAWDAPQEDEFALVNLGVPSPYATIAFPNDGSANDAWLELDTLPTPDRQRWERAVVAFFRQLTYARPGRLLLKSPTHTFRLPTLTRLFPQARWINIARNPYEVFSSTVRLWRSMYQAYGYQRPRLTGLEEFVLATFERMHERLERTRPLAPAGGIVDVRFEDLLAAPVETMRGVYAALELGDFAVVEPKVAEYFAARASFAANRHELEPRWQEEVSRRWLPYFERYGYSLAAKSARPANPAHA